MHDVVERGYLHALRPSLLLDTSDRSELITALIVWACPRDASPPDPFCGMISAQSSLPGGMAAASIWTAAWQR
jgi:hypothetical protein